MDPILAVVRGEAAVSSLKGAPKSGDAVRPALADLARGILHYSTRRRGLKGWAELLIRSDRIDLQPDEDSPDWDAFLSAIWDAASGLPLGAEAIAAAQRITASDVIPS